MHTISDWLNLNAPVRCFHVRQLSESEWRFTVNDTIRVVASVDGPWTVDAKGVEDLKMHKLYVPGPAKCWTRARDEAMAAALAEAVSESETCTADIVRPAVAKNTPRRPVVKRRVDAVKPAAPDNLESWTKDDWYELDL
ncbi:hypothetical protein [Andrias davidianus ranavirus]|uniref:Uncharacterized protein n=3 Tax=Ranavirus TaxID=10492 RepID=T2C5G3_9VIRU|nr:hypothetical protein [Andrias davidianus ranavirus]AHA80899.1 hypothetical protein [Chinese giant salamander iridovirus]AJR29129.1 hypothetical protein CH8/96_ORF46R [Testudo hermanni ranavirus]API65372.1 hypothetical protein RCV-Z_ORF61 [Rana catesbeiana virus]UYY91469.1 hypothetical protein [Percocypris pingi ranavirus]